MATPVMSPMGRLGRTNSLSDVTSSAAETRAQVVAQTVTPPPKHSGLFAPTIAFTMKQREKVEAAAAASAAVARGRVRGEPARPHAASPGSSTATPFFASSNAYPPDMRYHRPAPYEWSRPWDPSMWSLRYKGRDEAARHAEFESVMKAHAAVQARRTAAALRMQRAYRRYKARFTLARYKYQLWLDDTWDVEKLFCTYCDMGTVVQRDVIAQSIPGRHVDERDPLDCAALERESVPPDDGPLASKGIIAAFEWHLRQALRGQATIARFLRARHDSVLGLLVLLTPGTAEPFQLHNEQLLVAAQAPMERALLDAGPAASIKAPQDTLALPSPAASAAPRRGAAFSLRSQSGSIAESDEDEVGFRPRSLTNGSASSTAKARGQPVAAPAPAARPAPPPAVSFQQRISALLKGLRMNLGVFMMFCIDCNVLVEHRGIRFIAAMFKHAWMHEQVIVAQREAAKRSGAALGFHMQHYTALQASKAKAPAVGPSAGSQPMRRLSAYLHSIEADDDDETPDAGSPTRKVKDQHAAKAARRSAPPVWQMNIGLEGFSYALKLAAREYVSRAYGGEVGLYQQQRRLRRISGNGALATLEIFGAASLGSSSDLRRHSFVRVNSMGTAPTEEARGTPDSEEPTALGGSAASQRVDDLRKTLIAAASGEGDIASLSDQDRLLVFLSDVVWPAAQRRLAAIGGSRTWGVISHLRALARDADAAARAAEAAAHVLDGVMTPRMNAPSRQPSVSRASSGQPGPSPGPGYSVYSLATPRATGGMAGVISPPRAARTTSMDEGMRTPGAALEPNVAVGAARGHRQSIVALSNDELSGALAERELYMGIGEMLSSSTVSMERPTRVTTLPPTASAASVMSPRGRKPTMQKGYVEPMPGSLSFLAYVAGDPRVVGLMLRFEPHATAVFHRFAVPAAELDSMFAMPQTWFERDIIAYAEAKNQLSRLTVTTLHALSVGPRKRAGSTAAGSRSAAVEDPSVLERQEFNPVIQPPSDPRFRPALRGVKRMLYTDFLRAMIESGMLLPTLQSSPDTYVTLMRLFLATAPPADVDGATIAAVVDRCSQDVRLEYFKALLLAKQTLQQTAAELEQLATQAASAVLAGRRSSLVEALERRSTIVRTGPGYAMFQSDRVDRVLSGAAAQATAAADPRATKRRPSTLVIDTAQGAATLEFRGPDTTRRELTAALNQRRQQRAQSQNPAFDPSRRGSVHRAESEPPLISFLSPRTAKRAAGVLGMTNKRRDHRVGTGSTPTHADSVSIPSPTATITRSSSKAFFDSDADVQSSPDYSIGTPMTARAPSAGAASMNDTVGGDPAESDTTAHGDRRLTAAEKRAVEDETFRNMKFRRLLYAATGRHTVVGSLVGGAAGAAVDKVERGAFGAVDTSTRPVTPELVIPLTVEQAAAANSMSGGLNMDTAEELFVQLVDEIQSLQHLSYRVGNLGRRKSLVGAGPMERAHAALAKAGALRRLAQTSPLPEPLPRLTHLHAPSALHAAPPPQVPGAGAAAASASAVTIRLDGWSAPAEVIVRRLGTESTACVLPSLYAKLQRAFASRVRLHLVEVAKLRQVHAAAWAAIEVADYFGFPEGGVLAINGPATFLDRSYRPAAMTAAHGKQTAPGQAPPSLQVAATSTTGSAGTSGHGVNVSSKVLAAAAAASAASARANANDLRGAGMLLTDVPKLLATTGLQCSDTEWRLVLQELGIDCDIVVADAAALYKLGVRLASVAAQDSANAATDTEPVPPTMPSPAVATPDAIASTAGTKAATKAAAASARREELAMAAARGRATEQAEALEATLQMYESRLVITEVAFLAIVARIRKLRFRLLTTLMSEPQFVLCIASVAAAGIIDVPRDDTCLELRTRLSSTFTRVRTLLRDVDLLDHYRRVMPAPPDVDLPYWERCFSALLERVYRTYSLLADPTYSLSELAASGAPAPDDAMAQARRIPSRSTTRTPTLTATGVMQRSLLSDDSPAPGVARGTDEEAELTMQGAHMPLRAVMMFVQDCRLFRNHLRVADEDVAELVLLARSEAEEQARQAQQQGDQRASAVATPQPTQPPASRGASRGQPSRAGRRLVASSAAKPAAPVAARPAAPPVPASAPKLSTEEVLGSVSPALLAQLRMRFVETRVLSCLRSILMAQGQLPVWPHARLDPVPPQHRAQYERLVTSAARPPTTGYTGRYPPGAKVPGASQAAPATARGHKDVEVIDDRPMSLQQFLESLGARLPASSQDDGTPDSGVRRLSSSFTLLSAGFGDGLTPEQQRVALVSYLLQNVSNAAMLQASISFRVFRALMLQLLQLEFEARGGVGDDYLHPRGKVPQSLLPSSLQLPHAPADMEEALLQSSATSSAPPSYLLGSPRAAAWAAQQRRARPRGAFKRGNGAGGGSDAVADAGEDDLTRLLHSVVTWRPVKRSYDMGRFLVSQRRLSRIGISHAARKHLLGLTDEWTASPERPLSMPREEIGRVYGVQFHEPGDERGVDVNAARERAAMPSARIVRKKCVASPLLWTMLQALLHDAYFDGNWDGSRHAPRRWDNEDWGPLIRAERERAAAHAKSLGTVLGVPASVRSAMPGGATAVASSSSGSSESVHAVPHQPVESRRFSFSMSAMPDLLDSTKAAAAAATATAHSRRRSSIAAEGGSLSRAEEERRMLFSLPARVGDGISPYGAIMRFACGKLWAMFVTYGADKLVKLAQRVVDTVSAHAAQAGIIVINAQAPRIPSGSTTARSRAAAPAVPPGLEIVEALKQGNRAALRSLPPLDPTKPFVVRFVPEVLQATAAASSQLAPQPPAGASRATMQRSVSHGSGEADGSAASARSHGALAVPSSSQMAAVVGRRLSHMAQNMDLPSWGPDVVLEQHTDAPAISEDELREETARAAQVTSRPFSARYAAGRGDVEGTRSSVQTSSKSAGEQTVRADTSGPQGFELTIDLQDMTAERTDGDGAATSRGDGDADVGRATGDDATTPATGKELAGAPSGSQSKRLVVAPHFLHLRTVRTLQILKTAVSEVARLIQLWNVQQEAKGLLPITTAAIATRQGSSELALTNLAAAGSREEPPPIDPAALAASLHNLQRGESSSNAQTSRQRRFSVDAFPQAPSAPDRRLSISKLVGTASATAEDGAVVRQGSRATMDMDDEVASVAAQLRQHRPPSHQTAPAAHVAPHPSLMPSTATSADAAAHDARITATLAQAQQLVASAHADKQHAARDMAWMWGTADGVHAALGLQQAMEQTAVEDEVWTAGALWTLQSGATLDAGDESARSPRSVGLHAAKSTGRLYGASIAESASEEEDNAAGAADGEGAGGATQGGQSARAARRAVGKVVPPADGSGGSTSARPSVHKVPALAISSDGAAPDANAISAAPDATLPAGLHAHIAPRRIAVDAAQHQAAATSHVPHVPVNLLAAAMARVAEYRGLRETLVANRDTASAAIAIKRAADRAMLAEADDGIAALKRHVKNAWYHYRRLAAKLRGERSETARDLAVDEAQSGASMAAKLFGPVAAHSLLARMSVLPVDVSQEEVHAAARKARHVTSTTSMRAAHLPLSESATKVAQDVPMQSSSVSLGAKSLTVAVDSTLSLPAFRVASPRRLSAGSTAASGDLGTALPLLSTGAVETVIQAAATRRPSFPRLPNTVQLRSQQLVHSARWDDGKPKQGNDRVDMGQLAVAFDVLAVSAPAKPPPSTSVLTRPSDTAWLGSELLNPAPVTRSIQQAVFIPDVGVLLRSDVNILRCRDLHALRAARPYWDWLEDLTGTMASLLEPAVIQAAFLRNSNPKAGRSRQGLRRRGSVIGDAFVNAAEGRPTSEEAPAGDATDRQNTAPRSLADAAAAAVEDRLSEMVWYLHSYVHCLLLIQLRACRRTAPGALLYAMMQASEASLHQRPRTGSYIGDGVFPGVVDSHREGKDGGMSARRSSLDTEGRRSGTSTGAPELRASVEGASRRLSGTSPAPSPAAGAVQAEQKLDDTVASAAVSGAPSAGAPAAAVASSNLLSPSMPSRPLALEAGAAPAVLAVRVASRSDKDAQARMDSRAFTPWSSALQNIDADLQKAIAAEASELRPSTSATAEALHSRLSSAVPPVADQRGGAASAVERGAGSTLSKAGLSVVQSRGPRVSLDLSAIQVSPDAPNTVLVLPQGAGEQHAATSSMRWSSAAGNAVAASVPVIVLPDPCAAFDLPPSRSAAEDLMTQLHEHVRATTQAREPASVGLSSSSPRSPSGSPRAFTHGHASVASVPRGHAFFDITSYSASSATLSLSSLAAPRTLSTVLQTPSVSLASPEETRPMGAYLDALVRALPGNSFVRSSVREIRGGAAMHERRGSILTAPEVPPSAVPAALNPPPISSRTSVPSRGALRRTAPGEAQPPSRRSVRLPPEHGAESASAVRPSSSGGKGDEIRGASGV